MTLEEFLKTDENTRYCEILISPDGMIHYARPAHMYKLMDLTGLPMEELDQKMPKMASPVHWLVEYTGFISVWYNAFIAPVGITKSQIDVLFDLAMHGKINPLSAGEITMEMSLCKAIESGDQKELDTVSMTAKDVHLWDLFDYCKEEWEDDDTDRVRRAFGLHQRETWLAGNVH